MMAKKSHMSSVLKIALIILSICIVLLPLIGLIFSFFVIGYEPASYKNELNNPVINDDYKDWYTVELSNEETIMLPVEWSITNKESITVIVDEHGSNIAKGGKLLWGEDSSYQYEKLLEELLDYQVSIIEITQTKNIRSSRYGTITISAINTTDYDYILLSRSGSDNMLFIFESIAKETHSDLDDVLEAIVFSYVWK